MADRVVKYRFDADLGPLQAKMAAAGQSVGKFAKDLSGLDAQGAKMRAGLNTVGAAVGKFGLVAGAGLGMAAKSAMDWQSAWVGVLKTVEGSPAELAKLEDGLRNLATETGFAHAEVAAVAEAAGQLGISTGGIEKFTSTVLDMGVSTSLSSEEAATGLARLRNIMGSTESEISNTGSAMVALGNSTATTETEILAMSQRIAGAGRQAGLSTADVLGLSAAMSSVGIEAEAGGTAMSLTMKRIGKEVETGGEKLDLFARVSGMSAAEFSTAWQQDAGTALTTFVTGLGNAEAVGMSTNAVLRELGVTGIREADALLRLSGNAEGLAGALGTANTAFAENNALTEESGKFYATSAQQMKQAWAEIKDAAIDAGAVVLPVVSGIAGGVGDLASAFGDLPGPVKSATTGLLGVGAVLGGGVWAASKAVNGVASMQTALGNLGIEAGKSRAAMVNLGRGVSFAALIVGLGMVEDAIDSAFGRDGLKTEALQRDLDAIARGESVENLDRIVGAFNGLGIGIDQVIDKATGFVPDWVPLLGTTEIEKARETVGQFDEALAKMVEAGDVQGAADTLDGVFAAMEAAGISTAGARAELDAYALALRNAGEGGSFIDQAFSGVAAVADVLIGSVGGAGGAIEGMGVDAAGAADELAGLVEAMQEARSEALRAANAELNYEAALDDTRAALKANGRTLDITTEKGRANRKALYDQAAAFNALSAEAKNAPGAHRGAIRSFVDMADKMGMGRQRARELARSIIEIPDRKVDITADTSQVMGAVAATRAALASLQDERVIVTTEMHTIHRAPRAIARAAGGAVTGPATAARKPYLTKEQA